MLAIHDQITHELRSRLKTTVMGLGLVRLLQDAGLTEEARTTLYTLENGFQGVSEDSDKPSQNRHRHKVHRSPPVARHLHFPGSRPFAYHGFRPGPGRSEPNRAHKASSPQQM